MTQFKIGDRVTVDPEATFSGHRPVPAWMYESGEVYLATTGVDFEGDLLVRDAECYQSAYVNVRYVKPYVEDYTYDPGGEVVKGPEVLRGDTIACRYGNGTWGVGVTGANTRLLLDAVEIRLLHRPEPEVDPEQVQALAGLLDDAGVYMNVMIAKKLVKAGVTVA